MKAMIKMVWMAAAGFTMVACGSIEENPLFPDGNGNGDGKSDSVSRDITLTDAERGVSAQCNRFAWQLFEECTAAGAGNVVVSPMSANICLSMLANATAGESRRQILDALGFGDSDIATINSFNRKLAHDICGLDDNVELSVSNSLWYDVAIAPKPTFIEALSDSYGLQSFIIDHKTFGKDVNAWCCKYTNGLIPKAVDDNLDKDFALINALYFKGIWNSEYKFEKSLTRKDMFTNADGTTSEVEFMHNKGEYRYYCADTWRAMSIPFGGGGFRYTVILPDEGCSIDECLPSIREFDPATGQMYRRALDVKLPKYKMRHDIDLISKLKQMGISDIFNDRLADFSNMTAASMVIDLIKQSVSFEINEEGAEAAAVTIIGGIVTSVGPIENGYELFYADRPYVFMISERSTGAILFMGRIERF